LTRTGRRWILATASTATIDPRKILPEAPARAASLEPMHLLTGRIRMTVGLREFASKALEAKRIRFADLRRLQRDVLPCRITNRVEAEVLLALDGTVDRADRDWTDYVVPAVVEFAIWGLEPVGRIDQDKAVWLAEAASTARPKSAAAIMREVRRHAPQIDEGCRVPGRPAPAARSFECARDDR